MVSQKTLLGAQLGFGYEGDFSSSITWLGLTPMLRHYHQTNKKLLTFFEISAGGFLVQTTGINNIYGGLGSIRGGLDYFVFPNVSLGARFGPTLIYYDEQFIVDLGLRFALSIVFEKIRVPMKGLKSD